MSAGAALSGWVPKALRSSVRVLVLAARDFLRDNGPTWAAAITYYSLLSLFPLLLALGSIAAYFVDPQWAVQKATDYLGAYLTRGQAEIETIVKHALAAGRGGGLLFVLPLLWTGSLVFGTFTRALNVVFEAEERYSFLKRAMIRLAMLLTLGVLFIVALISPLVLRILRSMLGIFSGSDRLFDLALALVPAGGLLLTLFLAYRFVPRSRPDWRAAAFGAAVATALFFAARPLFLGYVRELAAYDVIYGSLTGMIVAVLWVWVVAIIALFGGQIASHSNAVQIRGEPIEEVERRHLRRSEKEQRDRERAA